MQHIYLTENAAERPQYMVEQLQDFVDDGFLTYNHDATPGGQMKVVSDCMRQHYLEYDWLSFLDVDEFLILRNQCAPHAGAQTPPSGDACTVGSRVPCVLFCCWCRVCLCLL